MKLTAVVPVREGSVRVKNKNIKPFARSTLLDVKLETLNELDGIDEIIVYSDSDVMLDIAKQYGVTTVKESDYDASSERSNSEFFEFLARETDSDYIMYSPVTCPFVSIETYNDIIYTFNESGGNIVTVADLKHHMWLDGKPLNYEIENSPNSQDLPNIVYITYGVCIISRSDMFIYRNIVTDNPIFYKLDEIESVDIDTEFDFMVAEIIYKKLKGIE